MGRPVNTAARMLRVSVVQQPDSCWLWTGPTATNGYGKATHLKKTHGAHRFLYEALVGAVPVGMHLDHLCRNRACVNPAHLEPVTPAENTRRGVGASALNARKVVCLRGHPLSGDNLYLTPDGRRQCRVCRNAAGMKRTAKREA